MTGSNWTDVSVEITCDKHKATLATLFNNHYDDSVKVRKRGRV